MEGWEPEAPQPSWAIVRDALDWNETYARNPKVNCLLDYYSTSPDNAADLQRMRAITALALTHSNGYVNFLGDTQYNWYDPFWSDQCGAQRFQKWKCRFIMK